MRITSDDSVQKRNSPIGPVIIVAIVELIRLITSIRQKSSLFGDSSSLVHY